jgi:hypothetical protein
MLRDEALHRRAPVDAKTARAAVADVEALRRQLDPDRR